MNLTLTKPPVARAEMRIRRPADVVYEAFVDPAVTTHFWFTRSSGRLEAGHAVRWDWEMYGHSTGVAVKTLEPQRRILLEWDGYSGRTTVEFTFTAHDDGSTHVAVTEAGWTGDGDALFRYVTDATEGFTWTLAGLKAWLEHGIEMQYVADRNPETHRAAG